jgi:hypothetical protein
LVSGRIGERANPAPNFVIEGAADEAELSLNWPSSIR